MTKSQPAKRPAKKGSKRSCSCRKATEQPCTCNQSTYTRYSDDLVYQLLFNKSPEGVFIMESEGKDAGKIIDANESAARMHGYTIEELRTMKITDLDVPENLRKAPERFRQIVDGEWIGGEVIHHKKDGTCIPIEFRAGPLRIGEKIFTLAFTQDISRHIEAEQTAVKSKNFLHSILGSIADPVFVKDEQHRWVVLNDAMCSFMGHSREELIGKSDYEFFPKEQADIFWEKDAIVFSTERENINEEQFTDAKGVEHTILTKKNIFTDATGKKMLVGVIRDITEKKKSEYVLQKLQNEQATILDSVRGWIFYKDTENRFVRVNKSFSEAMKKPKEQLEGKSMFDLYPKEQAEAFWQDDKAVIASGQPKIGIIESMQSPEGIRWVQTDKIPYRNKDGKIIGVIGFSLDITDRKTAEDEKKALAAIVESTDDAIFSKTTEGIIQSWNKGAEKMYGYKKEEVLGRNVTMLAPAACALEIAHILASIKRGESVIQYQTTRKHKNGRTLQVSLTISPISNAGVIIGASVTARDISTLKIAEEKILATKVRLEQEAENTKKFMEAVEASSVATVITTTEPAVIYANAAWVQLTGYSKEEAMGKNPRILQSGKTPKELYDRLWETIPRGDEFATDEIINRRKNGTEYNAELHVFPIMENGRTKYYVGLQTDITLRKRADLAKTEFMSLASHQLRTPLTGIRWGLSILARREKLTLNQQALVNELQQQTARMAESINVMLHLSRIEAGKMEVKSKTCNLSDIVKDLCNEFHGLAEQKQQQCNFRMDESIVITTDPALLKEILSNLASNAIKYTKNGGTIELTTKVLGDAVHISIRDEGYGIPMDQQEKVFSKFFRATNVVDKIPDGTGLGLYLVYSLAKLLSGRISFVSAENEGSTFSLTLPLHPPANP